MAKTPSEDTPRPARRPRLQLPFDNRREDAGLWAYDHRIGLCVTLIAYLVLMIVFVSSKIVVGRRATTQGMYIDLQTLAELEQQREAAFGQDSFEALKKLTREVISGSEFILYREDWAEAINRELDRCRTLCRQEGMVLEEMTPEQFNGRIPVKSYHELVAMLQYDGWDKLCRYLLGCRYAENDGFRAGEAEYGEFIADYVRSWHVSEENAREANPYDSFLFNEYAGHAYTVLKEYIRTFY